MNMNNTRTTILTNNSIVATAVANRNQYNSIKNTNSYI